MNLLIFIIINMICWAFPGDQLVWVNGHNLEELPYHVSVDLLRDSSTDVLSFVVIRQQQDHHLLQQRQSDLSQRHRRYIKFLNEQSPAQYYEEMFQQQLKHQRRQLSARASGTVSEVLLRDAVGPRVSASMDRHLSTSLPLCRECNLRNYQDTAFVPGAVPCANCDNLRVRLKVEYTGPSTVITIPITKDDVSTFKPNKIDPPSTATWTKMEIPINNKDEDEITPKYISTKIIKLKRSESKGEIGSSRGKLFFYYGFYFNFPQSEKSEEEAECF